MDELKEVVYSMNPNSAAEPDGMNGVGPLAQYTTDSSRFNTESVSEFIEDGQWNMTKVIQTAPPSQVHNILSTQLHLQHGQPDLAVWTLNTNGLFSVSFVWNSIREKKEKTKINTYSWQKNIPFKCSILLWRAIRGKLPTNEKLSRFGIEPSECHCCHSPVFPYISWPLGWSKLCTLIEKCTHDIKVTVVQWIKPPDRWAKLNIDGSALTNPGSIGVGGILRNHFGDIIFAFSVTLGEGTNNQDEVEAAIFGLSWCKDDRFGEELENLLRVLSRLPTLIPPLSGGERRGDSHCGGKGVGWHSHSYIHGRFVSKSRKRSRRKRFQFQDRHNNPHNFTVSVERNTQAMVTGDSSQRRHQNRSNIEVIHDDSVIGDCNMGRGGHNVEAASSSQGGMVGAEVLDKYKGIKGDSRPQTTAAQGQVQDEYNRKSANTGQDNINRPVQEDKSSAQIPQINKRQEVSTGQVVTGIDLMLPTPNPITNIDIIDEVAVGGLDWKGQETPTNLQEGVSKGRGELTHARHEDVDSDLSGDYRAPATPINNKQQTVTQQVTDTGQQHGRFNNKFGDRLSKKKREAIKKRLQQSMGKESDVIAADKQFSHQDQHMTNIKQNDDEHVVNKGNKGKKVKVTPDDFGVLNSEDDLDRDNQSMDDSDEDAEDTMTHTDQVVGSTFWDKYYDVQRMTEQQGLSPRGRKQTRHQLNHPVTSMSDNSSRPMTRSKSKEEKLGGIPYNMNKSFEFIGVIEACGLTDLGYTGLPFTWCNQRDAEARVWKRLDRSMVNDKWLEVMPQTTIQNLSSVGSDHSPLLMEMTKVIENHIKYFKFLHFWVDNSNFLKTVQQCWEKGVNGNPMWRLHQKMKRITATLSNWSKKEYGDIFTKVKEFEESIRQSEEELMTNNNEDSRQKLHQMNAKYIRRRRLFLHKICNDNEEWIQGEEQIAQAACEYYQQIFQGQNDRIDDRILQNIPTVVTPVQNEMLQAIPTMEELRQVVFSMNPNSAAGPDGIEGNNVVTKLDMTKAYDRVSWSFTCLTLRRFGFGELFIDLVWRILSNNWYSIIINGHRHGFFHSTRGLKKGDHLSPAKFILGVEVLNRLLNSLHQNINYRGFFMKPRGPQINHLSFADDVIIFASTNRHSLKLIMDRLGEYESTSGQLINKAKSHFMVPDNTAQDIIHTIKEVTTFSQKNSPITYLGCPLYIGRQRIIYYSHLVEKVSKKVCGWQARVLSFGRRITWIKHALQSIPIHTMAALSPPSTTIKYIKTIIADIYWGMDQNKRKYHWASLDTMSLPYTEGGVGIRRLSDICTSLQYKQWWNFRSKVSLWSQFLKAKYCQRAHPVAKKGVKDIAVWRLTEAGEFTCKSAWEMCNKKKATAVLNSQIWHTHIPFKMSFLLWRAIRYKLPTNESLANFGVEPVKCYCCLQQGWDDVEHIFLQGHFAGKNTAHTMIIHILLIVICWNLWKNREANGTADLLAKHSHQQDIVQNYYTHHQLPLPVKGSYLLEKLGVQNFRRKELKRIKQPP
ncbi:hypothetical protein MTR67_023592 [Solanum verrucosum]|uniref:Reverse transcriptase domain-containing protein n=1 Tax=Solanum verrucosum TaxID=315347 RepID=A0AAF0QTT1_SOLVR|nr:hypothetical protein MTR67_023592 [Solanum verrucosum]